MKIIAENDCIQITASGTFFKADGKTLRQREHDIASALAGLKFLTRAIKESYELSSEDVRTLVESAEKSLRILESEVKLNINLYRIKKS